MTEHAVLDPALPTPATTARPPRLHRTTQALLPALTLTTVGLNASKLPQYAMLVTLAAQAPWLRSALLARRHARQSGMLWSTLIATVLAAWGVWNWWIR